MIERTVLAQ